MTEYKLPYPPTSHGILVRENDRYLGTPSYQFGFDSDDIPILASRSGTIKEVNYSRRRISRTLRAITEKGFENSHNVNFVLVEHEDGTFGKYIHLRSDLAEARKSIQEI